MTNLNNLNADHLDQIGTVGGEQNDIRDAQELWDNINQHSQMVNDIVASIADYDPSKAHAC